MTEAKSGVRVW